MPLLRKFGNKFPTHRRRKEFIVIIIVGVLLVSLVFSYTYITNAPATPSDFPTMQVTCEEEINNEVYIECLIEFDDKKSSDLIEPLKSKIKVRGRYNAELPKKGYRLELTEEISLLGMRKDDDWLLNSLNLNLI